MFSSSILILSECRLFSPGIPDSQLLKLIATIQLCQWLTEGRWFQTILVSQPIKLMPTMQVY